MLRQRDFIHFCSDGGRLSGPPGHSEVDEASSRRDERMERAVEKKKEVAGGRLLTG